MSEKFELDVCDGKYTYKYDSGKQIVLRYGKPWLDDEIFGNRFLYSLAVELDEARKEIKRLKEESND